MGSNAKGTHPRRKDDILLKSAFEELFPFLLKFYFKDAEQLFDFSRAPVFLDKELSELFPEVEKSGGSRFVDMLAKVFLKNGEEEWILVHIEIQGGAAKVFPERMFRYWYRIYDRYAAHITALAVLTGNKSQKRSNKFFKSFLGTEISYKYNLIHILDYSQEELLAMENPFSLVVLAAQKALLRGRVPEEELAAHRLTIAKALLSSKKFTHRQIEKFLLFLKNFLYVADDEINSKFDEQIHRLSGKKITMGIIEAIKKIEREEGRQEGRQQGRQEGRKEGREEERRQFVTQLLSDTDFSIQRIAKLANVTEAFVKRIQAQAGKK